jgi:glucose/arabinose dehydrogenase
MTIYKHSFVPALLLGVLAAGLTVGARQGAPPPLAALVVPAGFKVEVFAENVGNARSMALGPQGTVFVGSQYAGNVYAVVDRDGDHKADQVLTIAKGLRQPNGLALRNGALYVATTSQILRFDDIEKHLDAPPAPVIVKDNLPNPNQGVEVHCVRPGRHALRVGWLHVQRVRAGGDDRGDRADEARWLRYGGLR